MATEQSPTRAEAAVDVDADLRYGSVLMTLAGVAFVGYGVVFLALAFLGDGFELGVSTLDGLSRAELAASSPETAYYITHLHVATAAFIIATGLAVATLAWYGVRSRQRWAWATAVTAPVIGLALALPMHYVEGFEHDWIAHLAPLYVATAVFVIGALLALRSISGDSASTS